MGFFSSIGSFVSKAVSTVASVAKKTFETAKQVVGQAVEFLATRAEELVEDVKETWARVKPYVEKFRHYVKLAASHVPIPWMKVALTTVDKGLEALFAFENSPVAKKIEEAIQWAIKMALSQICVGSMWANALTEWVCHAEEGIRAIAGVAGRAQPGPAAPGIPEGR